MTDGQGKQQSRSEQQLALRGRIIAAVLSDKLPFEVSFRASMLAHKSSFRPTDSNAFHPSMKKEITRELRNLGVAEATIYTSETDVACVIESAEVLVDNQALDQRVYRNAVREINKVLGQPDLGMGR